MFAGSSATVGAAVITGAGSGIGRALAERLAGQGRHVLGVSRDVGGWAARAALPAGLDVVAANLSTSEGIAWALEQIHDVADEKGEPRERAQPDSGRRGDRLPDLVAD